MNHDVVPPISTEETTDASPDLLIHCLHTWQAAVQKKLLVIFEMFLLLNVNLITTVKVIQQNESKSAPSTVKIGDTTYYLNKGEKINFQGHQYFAHKTMTYRISQHDVATMEKALVDRGANGGICGDDMLVLEGSERFVDEFRLAGHKVSQLRIVTAQA
jgi:hypothetical protein